MTNDQPTVRPALLYGKLKGNRVRCLVCQRRCLISDGEMGYCTTRMNRRGELFTLMYGWVSTQQVAPAERKPLFHFYPGSRYLSLGSLGCNFRCPGCQNWEIAHVQLNAQTLRETEPAVHFLRPEKAVQMAQDLGCQGLSWTYNEPTVWLEYVLDGAKLAKQRGLLTNVVTNGYMTPGALDLLGGYLDAYRVDIKAFSQKSYRRLANVRDWDSILKVAKRAKDQWGIHVEVITNVVPGQNDDRRQLNGIAKWIYQELGADTPWHVTRFFPYGGLSHLPPTPISILERARQIGLDTGLHYVYLGNVPGHLAQNTYCPGCRALLIERKNDHIIRYAIEAGRCPSCGQVIPIVGQYVLSSDTGAS